MWGYKMSVGRYDDKIKVEAVKLREAGLSYPEVMEKLNIASRGAIRLWERKYKSGGVEELLKDERGLKTTGRPRKIKE